MVSPQRGALWETPPLFGGHLQSTRKPLHREGTQGIRPWGRGLRAGLQEVVAVGDSTPATPGSPGSFASSPMVMWRLGAGWFVQSHRYPLVEPGWASHLTQAPWSLRLPPSRLCQPSDGTAPSGALSVLSLHQGLPTSQEWKGRAWPHLVPLAGSSQLQSCGPRAVCTASCPPSGLRPSPGSTHPTRGLQASPGDSRTVAKGTACPLVHPDVALAPPTVSLP